MIDRPPKPSETLHLKVTAEHHGTRLDHCITAVLPSRSRSQIQRLIRNGHVHLNKKSIRASHTVHVGDVIDLEIPEPESPEPSPEALPITIIHDDPDLVVVNKPAGMVVHPAIGHTDGTLVNALLHHVTDLSGIGGKQRPGIVHRLDRGSSGLIVVAKHDTAHVELSRQFADREVDKEYVALVWGLLNTGRRIDAPIGRDPTNRKKMSTRASRVRTAVTRITGTERLRGLTLARVAIATGRTHQIRVHLSAIGHPVVGDTVYGGVRRHLAADHRILTTIGRPFLHSWRLAFRHPRDGRKVEFIAPLPTDLERILNELRGRLNH